ncbi:MAG: hypothetical protein QNJ97_11080 [Myxococcota bacterium]|nr:hypothetical protein [Myxococcota bacterium]
MNMKLFADYTETSGWSTAEIIDAIEQEIENEQIVLPSASQKAPF